MKTFATILATLLLAGPAYSQTPDDEAAAALALAQAAKKKVVTVNDGCQCGCVLTGSCVCKNCNTPKLKPGDVLKTDCICGCVKTGKCSCKDCNHPKVKATVGESLSYSDGCALAVQTDKPLVTFVGVMPPRPPLYQVVTCFAYGLPGYPERCIVVSVPNHSGAIDCNGLHWRATLPVDATDGQIMAVVQQRSGFMPPVDPVDPIPSPRAATFGASDQGSCANGNCAVPQTRGLFRRR